MFHKDKKVSDKNLTPNPDLEGTKEVEQNTVSSKDRNKCNSRSANIKQYRRTQQVSSV